MGMLMRRHRDRHKPKPEEQPTIESAAPVVPVDGTLLPDGFPARTALAAAGIVTAEQILEHEDLTSIAGIGDATAGKITAALAELAAAAAPVAKADADSDPPPVVDSEAAVEPPAVTDET